MAVQLPTMDKYISQLDVSLHKADEELFDSKAFTKIDVDLNQGSCGCQANPIYLWYKRGSVPITRLQVTFNNDMAVGLTNVEYTKIDKDLNAGAGGDIIYLWFFRGSGEYDAPIVDIDVTADAESEARMFGNDWERLACDLNRRAGGKWIHIWVRREKKTYICDVTATDSYGLDKDYFQTGYNRVDEDTNRGAGGSPVFIWYRQTTDSQRALTDLKVSTDDTEYQALKQQHYKSVSVNLNDGNEGNPVYLWYKKDKSKNSIKAITLLLNTAAVDEYKKAGVTVIGRNLNRGDGGHIEYLCVNQ